MYSCVFSLITFHFSDISISTHVWMFLAEIHLMLIKSERWTRATRHLYHYSCPSNVIQLFFLSKCKNDDFVFCAKKNTSNWWFHTNAWRDMELNEWISKWPDLIACIWLGMTIMLTIKSWITIKTLSNALSFVWNWAKCFCY